MSKKQITIPIFIPHSGCPHCCIFCNQWRISSAAKLPAIEDMEKTIALYLHELSDTIERVELAFFGGSFTAIDSSIQENFLKAVNNSPYFYRIDGIRVSTRPDYIEIENLEMLKKYNVETVELGVQSFSFDVLEQSGRGHSTEDVDNAMIMLKSMGFRTGIQIMPGLPGDTRESILFTGKRALELQPDDVRIYPTVVLRDTGLEALYNEGRFTPLTIEEAVEVSSSLYEMFFLNGINIIRMGIHPFDIESDSVIAGPYHTAFGFLVKARYRQKVMLNDLNKLLTGNEINSIRIDIPRRFCEEYIGMKKENIIFLREHFNVSNIDYSISDIESPKYEFSY